MVGHQTIGPDINATTTAPFCHQVDVLPYNHCHKKMFPAYDCRVALYDADIREQRFVLCVPSIHNVMTETDRK
jgi:hypothetical protein